MSKIQIYTDGGASPNPGRGGWAAVIIQDGKVIQELSGGVEQTSNNRMELTAAIKGLQAIATDQTINLYTDSNYLRQGITSWIKRWKRNGWRTASKQPVKNQDLWQALDEVVGQRTIKWHWVKGHAGDEWNEYVDALVGQARGAMSTE